MPDHDQVTKDRLQLSSGAASTASRPARLLGAGPGDPQLKRPAPRSGRRLSSGRVAPSLDSALMRHPEAGLDAVARWRPPTGSAAGRSSTLLAIVCEGVGDGGAVTAKGGGRSAVVRVGAIRSLCWSVGPLPLLKALGSSR